MPMEIEGWDHARWTSTAAFPTRNAPFAGLGAVVLPGAEKKLAQNTTQGLKLIIRRCVESKFMAMGAGGVGGGAMYRAPTAEEVALSVVPKLQELGFEVVGEPKYMLDDNPVWMYRKVGKPLCKYELYLGSGPFTGLTTGTCQDKPTVENKIKFAPMSIYQWSADIRPVERELTEEKQREVLRVMRESHEVLGKISGLCIMAFKRTGKPFLVDPVPVPDPPTPNKSFFGTTALIIGLALAGMTFIKRT